MSDFMIVDESRRLDRRSLRPSKFDELQKALADGQTALVPYAASGQDRTRVNVTSNLGRRLGRAYKVRSSMQVDGLVVWAEKR